EPVRQPVEQLGMRRLFTEHAEVIDGRDEAAAEEMMPDAVHPDARGERVVRRSDQIGDDLASGAVFNRMIQSAERFKVAPTNGLPRFAGATANQHRLIDA